MSQWYAELNGVEFFFLTCAVIGAVFVVLRLVLLFIGIETDISGDMDIQLDEIDIHHADSDVGFKLLSLQSLSAFLLMFGLVGFALYNENREGILISLAGAVAAGLTAVWSIGKLFSLFEKLQSTGTIDLQNALKAEGKVYLDIPENGTGRVLIHIQNRLREYDARAADNKGLKTGEPIRVVQVQGNLLIVEKI